MKKILLLFVFISGVSFGQMTKSAPPPKIDNFRFINGNMNDSFVLEILGKKKNEIYQKTLDWLRLNYTDIDAVVLSKIENEMIRFNGITNGELNASTYYEQAGLFYQIQIDIKDNKIKITSQRLQMIDHKNEKYDLDLPLSEKFTEYGRTLTFSDVPNILNKKITDLKNYILSTSNKDDW